MLDKISNGFVVILVGAGAHTLNTWLMTGSNLPVGMRIINVIIIAYFTSIIYEALREWLNE